MKKIIIALILILSVTTIIADSPIILELNQGKNIFYTEDYFKTVYASQLITKYPQIQSISIYEYGNSFGYLNTMGGIGTNIPLEPRREYEIYTSENITISLSEI